MQVHEGFVSRPLLQSSADHPILLRLQILRFSNSAPSLRFFSSATLPYSLRSISLALHIIQLSIFCPAVKKVAHPALKCTSIFPY